MRAFLAIALFMATLLITPTAQGEPTDPPQPPPPSTAPATPPPGTTGPSAGANNHSATVYDETGSDLSPQRGRDRAPSPAGAPRGPSNPDGGENAPKIKNAPKKVNVQINSEPCTDFGVEQCSQSRAACDADAGGTNYRSPTITWIKIDNGPWTYHGLTCGPPTSITLPGVEGTVQVQQPPVPTFAQIQTAFRELPFSKPSVTVQSRGNKTLKGLKTFYAAQWPDDSGLEPGEVSDKIKLLSWTVEFKVAAKEYRYDFGDGTTSGWTTSTGGTYPDGDVVHTYKDTGTREIKVDARLTGQYRVNGGQWQDIATVADLQDEPVETLEVLGTRTRLTS